MLKYIDTSLLQSNAQTVVNTVNTVGVMGKGLAAQFKKRYPAMFERYKEICDESLLTIGKLWLWKAEEQWVLNFPTKQHWRNPSKLSYIRAGLEKFVATYDERGITEISFPRLGCGNGGLNWDEVRVLMHQHLAPLPIRIYIHDFAADIGRPEHELEDGTQLPKNYDEFCSDIRRLIYESGGHFFTPESQSTFRATLGDSEELAIEIVRGSKRTRIRDDDLYSIWELLPTGPVTKEQMAGSARTEAYYLLGILLGLPYMRRTSVRDDVDTSARLAVEMVTRHPGPAARDLGDKSVANQEQLEWH